MVVHNCEHCDYKSNQRWCVRRHSSNRHTNLTSSLNNAVERSQQFPLQQPSQPSLPNIHVPMQIPIGSGQNEVAYSDEDTNSGHSSDGNQYDFFGADSDSESDTIEPGEYLDNIMDELGEAYGGIVEIQGRLRGALAKIKEVDTEKKRKIFKKAAELQVKIFDDGVGINTEEDSDAEDDADESEEDEKEESKEDEDEQEDEDQDEGVNLGDDNPFSVLKEIKLAVDEQDNEIYDEEFDKAIKKRTKEKQEEIDQDESSDESDNGCGATEKVFKQDEKKLRQCINGVEYEGSAYFEHCSNDKIDTIYRWCKHILNTEEKFDKKNLHKVKVKWMPIRFHVRALADPEQSVEAKRKILQKASVGEGVLSGLAKLALPMMKTFFRVMQDRD